MYSRKIVEGYLQRFVVKEKFSSIAENLDAFDVLLKNAEDKDATLPYKRATYNQAENVATEIINLVDRPDHQMAIKRRLLEPLKRRQAEVEDLLEMSAEDRKQLEEKSFDLCRQQATHHSAIIQKFSSFKSEVRKSCYICYAWSVLDKENFVQPFLEELYTELKAANIIPYLDTKDCGVGANIIKFMEQCKTSTFVLIIGTESLLERHNEGVSNVCSELSMIGQRLIVDKKCNVNKVFTLLISGTTRTAIPPFLLANTIFDMRELGYVKGVEKIVETFNSE